MIGQCFSKDRFNVIILAGGKGSRMGESSEYIPKALVELGNSRVIDHIVNRYWNVAHKLIVGVGRHGDLLKAYLLGRYPKGFFDFSEETEPRNNAWSLLYALDHADSRYPTVVTFCDLIMVGNFPLVAEASIYYADEKTKGHMGTFRHALIDGHIRKNSEPLPLAESGSGILGCFVFPDTIGLKGDVYELGSCNELTDITDDLVAVTTKPIHCEAAYDVGTSADLAAVRKLWEEV